MTERIRAGSAPAPARGGHHDRSFLPATGSAARVARTAGAPPLRLVLLGDSAALGVGVDRLGDTIGGQLAELLAEGPGGRQVHLSSVGVSGSRSTDLATQVARALLGERPDVAVILVGANDVTGMRRPAEAAAYLARPCTGCGTPVSRSWSAPARISARYARSQRPCGRSSAGWAPRRPGTDRCGARRRWDGCRSGHRDGTGVPGRRRHLLPRRLPPLRRRLPGLGARPAARRGRRSGRHPTPLNRLLVRVARG